MGLSLECLTDFSSLSEKEKESFVSIEDILSQEIKLQLKEESNVSKKFKNKKLQKVWRR